MVSSSKIRTFLLAAAFLPATVLPYCARAQTVPGNSMAVLQFANPSGDSRLELLAPRARDESVSLLELSEQFRVHTVAPAVSRDLNLTAGTGVKELEAAAAGLEADYILSGSVGPDRTGRLVLRMWVYDRAENRVLTSSRTAGSMFDILESAREATGELFTDLTGFQLAFGSLQLRRTGEEGVYEVLLDGRPVGTNRSVLNKVLVGEHRLEIRQNRMLGPHTLLSEAVPVQEGGRAVVEFEIPYLLPSERNEIDQLLGQIEDLDEDRDERETVRSLYTDLVELFDDVSYCRSLSELRDRYRQQEAEYLLDALLWDLADQFYLPERTLFDQLTGLYADAAGFPEPEVLLRKIEADAGFLFSVLRLNVAYRFSNGYWEEGMDLYHYMEQVYSALPLRDRQWFEAEYAYVTRRWNRYLKKARKSETFAEVGISLGINRKFKKSMRTCEDVLVHYELVSPAELIVITEPTGLPVLIDGRKRGKSPLRLHKLDGAEVKVQVDHEWFSSSTVALDHDRNFAFLSVSAGRPPGPHTPQVRGRGRVKLSWDGIPRAVSYTVQVARAGSWFRKPLYQASVQSTDHNMDRKLGPGTYWFRVRGTDESGVHGLWGYGPVFVVE
jgi:TolB-like protein